MNAADAVSCDVDGAFHRPGRETEGEGGTKSEGKSFLGSTMESKESEQKRREREKSTCGADRATQIGSPPEIPILQPTLHLRTDTRRTIA